MIEHEIKTTIRTLRAGGTGDTRVAIDPSPDMTVNTNPSYIDDFTLHTTGLPHFLTLCLRTVCTLFDYLIIHFISHFETEFLKQSNKVLC